MGLLNFLFKQKKLTRQDASIVEENQSQYTPDCILSLKENEIFVFGSNLRGWHQGGAAKHAQRYFGAVWGQGEGLQGQSYAIPTMQGDIDTIKPYVDNFRVFTGMT